MFETVSSRKRKPKNTSNGSSVSWPTLIGGIAIGLAVGAGGMWAAQNLSAAEPVAAAQPSPSPSPEASPVGQPTAAEASADVGAEAPTPTAEATATPKPRKAKATRKPARKKARAKATPTATPVATLASVEPTPLPTPRPVVTPPLLPITPKAVSTTKPKYPAIAKRQGLSGAVTLLVGIDGAGKVTNAKVVSRASLFDQPALDAVKKWRFMPFQQGGEPMPVRFRVTVKFDPKRA